MNRSTSRREELLGHTKWYKKAQRPIRVGVYERRFKKDGVTKFYFSLWNGARWSIRRRKIGRLEVDGPFKSSTLQDLPWRGLTKPAPDAPQLVVNNPHHDCALMGRLVLVGSTVTYRNLDSYEVKTVTIVHAHEIDTGASKISLNSPVGKSLIKNREGDVVLTLAPEGRNELEILRVENQGVECTTPF